MPLVTRLNPLEGKMTVLKLGLNIIASSDNVNFFTCKQIIRRGSAVAARLGESIIY